MNTKISAIRPKQYRTLQFQGHQGVMVVMVYTFLYAISMSQVTFMSKTQINIKKDIWKVIT